MPDALRWRKPDAANPRVRLDERGRETAPMPPRPPSTPQPYDLKFGKFSLDVDQEIIARNPAAVQFLLGGLHKMRTIRSNLGNRCKTIF